MKGWFCFIFLIFIGAICVKMSIYRKNNGKKWRAKAIFTVGVSVLFCFYISLWIAPSVQGYAVNDAIKEVPEEPAAKFIGRKSLYSGIVDTGGNILLEPEWWTIDSYGEYWIVSKDFKYGVLDENFVIRNALQWDDICGIEVNGFICVKSKGKYGYIDSGDQVVIQPEWDNVQFMETAYRSGQWYVIVEKDGRQGIINENGLVTEPQYTKIWPFSEGVAVVELDGKYGYIDWQGRMVYPVTLDYALDFYEGLAIVGKDGQYGFINLKGEIVIDIIYSGVHRSQDEWIAAARNGKVGMINIAGETVIPFEWHSMPKGGFEGDYLQVTKYGKVGLIDRNGSVIVEPRFDRIYITGKDSLWMVLENEKYGCIRKDGSIVFETEYDYIYMRDDLVLLKRNDCYGIYNQDGKEMIPIMWQFLEQMLILNEPTFIVSDGSGYGVINLKNELLLDLVYDELEVLGNDAEHREGFSITGQNSTSEYVSLKMKKDGLYGIVTSDGEEIMPAQWEEITTLLNIGYQVRKDGLYGIVGFNGQWLYEPQWNYIEISTLEGSLSGGFCMVQKDGLWGFITPDGKLIEPQWVMGSYFSDGMAMVYQDGQYGFINTRGEMAVPFWWPVAKPFYKGYAIVGKDDKVGVIDKQGNIVIAVEWDSLEIVP